MNITIKTNVIRNNVNDLNNLSNYYKNKSTFFQKSVFNNKLSSVLTEVRSTYNAISSNIQALSKYLDTYQKDVESLENKMSGKSSGYISSSSVNSIVSKSVDSIKKCPIDYDRLFSNIDNLTFENSKLSSVSNIDLSKFQLSSEAMQVLLLTSNQKKNFTQKEIEFLSAYYKNYYNTSLQQQTAKVSFAEGELKRLENIEKNLRQHGYIDFAALERALKNASTEEEKAKLQKIMATTGFTSSASYLNALKNAQKELNTELANKQSIEQALKTISYTFGMNSVDYQKFINQANIKEESLRSLMVYASASNVATISYQDYVKKYGEVDPLTFQEEVKRICGPNVSIVGIKENEYADLKKINGVAPDVANYYKFLYQTKGQKEASKYLEDMQDTINMKAGEVKAQEFLKGLVNLNDEDTRLKAVTNHLGVTLKGLDEGIQGFGQNLKYLGEGLFSNSENRIYSSSEYEAMYILQALSSEQTKLESGLITKDAKGSLCSSSDLIDYTADYGKLLNHNFQISQSIGNMLPSIALSATVPMVGQASFGASAAGGSFHSAMVEGYSKNAALKYGAVSGASELLTEKVLGGIPLLSESQVTSFKTLLRSCLKEGNEEFVQSYIDAIAGKVLLNKTVDKEELTQEAIQSAVYGAITGGIMNIPSFAINSSSIKTVQNQIKSGNVSESDFVSAMHSLIPETKNMSYQQIIEEYSSPSKNIVLELATQNGRNTSKNGASSLLSGLGLFGLGSNMFESSSSKFESAASNSMSKTAITSQQNATFSSNADTLSRNTDIEMPNAKNISKIEGFKSQMQNFTQTIVSAKNSQTLNKAAKKSVQLLSRVAKIGSGFSLLSTIFSLNPALGAVAFVPSLSLICDGVYGNIIKNSFLINFEGRTIQTKEGKKKASLLYQNVFALEDIIKSRFVDNKQNYFLARSVNALQYLESNKSYGTVSQAFTLALLKKAQKMGFIKNLTFQKSDLKTNLTLERILLGVDQKNKNRQMYNMYFETTDKVFTKADIDVLLKGMDLNDFTIKTDKAGRILFDVDVSLNDVKAKISNSVSNLLSLIGISSFSDLVNQNSLEKTMASVSDKVNMVLSNDLHESSNNLNSMNTVAVDSMNTLTSSINSEEHVDVKNKMKEVVSYQNANTIESYFDQFPAQGRYGCNQDLPRIIVERNVPRVSELVQVVQSQFSDISYENAVKLIGNMNTSSGVCDYAALVNTVVNLFRDKPEVFESHMGYALTYTNDAGFTLLNDDLILLDLFCFLNHEALADKANDFNVTSQNKQYVNTNYKEETASLISKWLASKNLNFEMECESIYNNYDVLPWKKGLDVPLEKLNDYLINHVEAALEHDSVVLTVDPTRQQRQAKFLYLYDVDGELHILDGAHSMTILGIQDATHFIVDSWGKKCIVDINELREKNMSFSLNIVKFQENGSSHVNFITPVSIETQNLLGQFSEISEIDNQRHFIWRLREEFSKEVKIEFVKNLIETGKINELPSAPVVDIMQDEDLVHLLAGTDKLNDVLLKNLVRLPEALVYWLNPLTKSEFDAIFDSQAMKNFFQEMHYPDFAYVFKFLREDENSTVNNTILEKITSLSKEDFYDCVQKNQWYIMQPNLELFRKGASIKNYDSFIQRIVDNYCDDLLHQKKLREYLIQNISDKSEESQGILKLRTLLSQIDKQFQEKTAMLFPYPIEVESSSYIKIFSEQEGWYNLEYEIDGKIENISLLANLSFNSNDFSRTNSIDFFPDEVVQKAILDGKFQVRNLEYDERKNKLYFDNSLISDLNLAEIEIDGKVVKKVVKSGYEGLDLSPFVPTDATIGEVSISAIPSLNQPKEYFDAIYKLVGFINGEEVSYYIPSDIYNNSMLDVNSVMVNHNLYNLENPQIVEVSLSDIDTSVYNILNKKNSEEVFHSSLYGGDQSSVEDTLKKFIFRDEKLSSVDIFKAQNITNVIKRYFPDINNTDMIKIAKSYSNVGCGYMAYSNALISYFNSLENGSQLFKEKFGYDLLFEDGHIKYFNFESLALDIFLTHISTGDVGETCRNAQGISQDSREKVLEKFLPSRGIHYTIKTYDSKNTYADSVLQILDSSSPLDTYYFLGASNFDLDYLDGYFVNSSSDKALSDASKTLNSFQDIGWHAMLVTDFNSDGDFIVSSWSGKYKLSKNSFMNHYKKDSPMVFGLSALNFSIKE